MTMARKDILQGPIFIVIDPWSGDSMKPTLVPGDRVLFVRGVLPPRVNDIILFRVGQNRLIGHRVARVGLLGGEMVYYTKGDSHENLDKGYRTNSDIIGRFISKLPNTRHKPNLPLIMAGVISK